MQPYDICITCNTYADSPEEAIRIALEQIADRSAYCEVTNTDTDEIEFEGHLGDEEED